MAIRPLHAMNMDLLYHIPKKNSIESFPNIPAIPFGLRHFSIRLIADHILFLFQHIDIIMSVMPEQRPAA